MEKLITNIAVLSCFVVAIIMWFAILMIPFGGQPDKNTTMTKNSELCAIRYYSKTNLWIDFVVLIKKKDLPAIRKLVMSAMDTFWNDDEYCHVPYGDVVEMTIEKAGFPYGFAYHPIPKADDSEEEKVWEDFLKSIKNTMDLVVINET